jgi:hypothetical protein
VREKLTTTLIQCWGGRTTVWEITIQSNLAEDGIKKKSNVTLCGQVWPRAPHDKCVAPEAFARSITALKQSTLGKTNDFATGHQ